MITVLKDGEDIGHIDLDAQEVYTDDDSLDGLVYQALDEGIPVYSRPGAVRMEEADEENLTAYLKDCGYDIQSDAKETEDAEPELEAENWNFQGIPINIENLAGSTRHGEGFHTRMTAPYGYIRNTEGTDGDAVDCFVGPVLDAAYVYVIHTKDRHTGLYDEDKCVLGVESAREAKKLFDENYNKTGFFESMERFSVRDFKAQLTKLRGRKLTRAAAIPPIVVNVAPPEITIHVDGNKPGTRTGKVIRNKDGSMNFITQEMKDHVNKA